MVSTVMTYPWATAVVIALVIAGLIGGWYAKRPKTKAEDTLWLANASYITSLPSYRNQVGLYRTGLIIATLVLIGATIAAGIIAARPVERKEFSEELASRDIVLCLDVSGSMIAYAEEIVDRFLELLPSFQGERIALSIWNSTSRTVFPLTNDYEMVERELEEARYVLSFDLDSIGSFMDYEHYDRLIEFVEGTYLPDLDAASLIGDGLATCTLMFDEADEDRSRSIIFATDNDVQGVPIYELDEAADLVVDKDITLFGIHAGESTEAQIEEYRSVVTDRDGLFYEASNPNLVEGVLDRINETQASSIDATPVVTERDTSTTPFVTLLVLSGFYLGFVWWLRS